MQTNTEYTSIIATSMWVTLFPVLILVLLKKICICLDVILKESNFLFRTLYLVPVRPEPCAALGILQTFMVIGCVVMSKGTITQQRCQELFVS